MNDTNLGLPHGAYVVTQLVYSPAAKTFIAVMDIDAVARQHRRVFLRALDGDVYREVTLGPKTMILEVVTAAAAPYAYANTIRWADQGCTHGDGAGVVRIDLLTGRTAVIDLPQDQVVQLVGANADGSVLYVVMREPNCLSADSVEFAHSLVEWTIGRGPRVLAAMPSWFA